MSRYSKYFLQNILCLNDGFCKYYLQDDRWGRQEILDVESLIFDWSEDAEQWLNQCAQYDQVTTLHQLRTFLAEDCLDNFEVHRMNNRRVIRTAARYISRNACRVVIKPGFGWAVLVDESTAEPAQPPSVAPEPDLAGLISGLENDLDALVAQQQKNYNAHEAAMAGMTRRKKPSITAGTRAARSMIALSPTP